MSSYIACMGSTVKLSVISSPVVPIVVVIITRLERYRDRIIAVPDCHELPLHLESVSSVPKE